MLYTKEPLKENFLVMVAELFYWFEIKPLSVVTGGGGVSAPASGEGDGKFNFIKYLFSFFSTAICKILIVNC